MLVDPIISQSVIKLGNRHIFSRRNILRLQSFIARRQKIFFNTVDKKILQMLAHNSATHKESVNRRRAALNARQNDRHNPVVAEFVSHSPSINPTADVDEPIKLEKCAAARRQIELIRLVDELHHACLRPLVEFNTLGSQMKAPKERIIIHALSGVRALGVVEVLLRFDGILRSRARLHKMLTPNIFDASRKLLDIRRKFGDGDLGQACADVLALIGHVIEKYERRQPDVKFPSHIRDILDLVLPIDFERNEIVSSQNHVRVTTPNFLDVRQIIFRADGEHHSARNHLLDQALHSFINCADPVVAQLDPVDAVFAEHAAP